MGSYFRLGIYLVVLGLEVEEGLETSRHWICNDRPAVEGHHSHRLHDLIMTPIFVRQVVPQIIADIFILVDEGTAVVVRFAQIRALKGLWL